MTVFPFERLEVWQESRVLVREIYQLLSKLPRTEEYGLKEQIRRASISICLNLAEGCSRQRGKEQANFYKYAFGSLMETISALILAVDLDFLREEDIYPLKNKGSVIAKRINALRKASLSFKA